jgi:hypothetical protein
LVSMVCPIKSSSPMVMMEALTIFIDAKFAAKVRDG